MPHAPIVCYDYPAKPSSGYGRAVRGYAEKLARVLGFDALPLAQLPDGVVPEVTIGLQTHAWPDARPLYAFKARPYEEMHGQGLSMHPLTCAQLAQAGSIDVSAPYGLVCIANPHWLMTGAAQWAQHLQGWAQVNDLAGLVVTNSPRTNPLMWSELVKELQRVTETCLGFNDALSGENRYLDALAGAQVIAVLGSSRSMASEAAITGMPIAYVADEIGEQTAFFDAIKAQMGGEAVRFSPFSAQNALKRHQHAPFDVTDRYVEMVLREIKAQRAA